MLTLVGMYKLTSPAESVKSSHPESVTQRDFTRKPPRYHPVLVALHWTSAALILAALVTGIVWLREVPNSSPDKILLLRAHLVLGIAILVLITSQFAARLLAPRPHPATTGKTVFDSIAAITHIGLYLAVILMVVSGVATALAAGLPAIVFGNSVAALPESFDVFISRVAHGVLAKVIIGLVLLHSLGTFYHLMFRKDGLLRRMWFGPR